MNESADRKVLGFVAFRSGSKRLLFKNGEQIGGRPLYQISLDKLLGMKRAGLLDAVVASTDSPEWAEDCKELYNDDVIIHRRSADVSSDCAGEGDVLQEFFALHPELQNHAVLLLLCTYPFLKTEILSSLIEKYINSGDSVFAVAEAHHMPQKLLRIDSDNLQPYFYDSFVEFEPNTKLLKEKHPEAYHTTGGFLIADAAAFAQGNSVWNQPRIQYIVDDSFHIDVDNECDLQMARLYYESRNVQ